MGGVGGGAVSARAALEHQAGGSAEVCKARSCRWRVGQGCSCHVCTVATQLRFPPLASTPSCTA